MIFLYFKLLINYFLNHKFVIKDNISIQDQVFVYTLYLHYYLYSLPHYRNKNFREDCIQNLKNVIFPNLPFSISILFYNKFIYLFFLIFIYPIIILYNKSIFYESWFTYWRINCVLGSINELKTKNNEYKLENKWEFIKECNLINYPIAPIKNNDIVIKHKNIEGGLGIYFYKNTKNGGDWIIQEKLENSNFIKDLLDINSPLSTIRVVTAKDHSYYTITSVFRAGFINMMTDHNSILFSINNYTGQIETGKTNQNWYNYKKKYMKNITTYNNKQVSGKYIPNFAYIKQICLEGHEKMLKDIPIVGWDVALTETGIYILEVNLSCNLFLGNFDQEKYFNLVASYFA